MFTRIRIAPDRVEITDRAALLVWAIIAVLVGAFAIGCWTTWRDAPAGRLDWHTGLVTAGFAFTLLCVWLTRRMWLTSCRVESGPRRILVERRSLRERQHRWIGFADVADVVLRERKDDEGDWVRGLHLVLRDGERVDLIAVDQTDGGRFAPLADAIREMVSRPGGPTRLPSPPAA